MITREGIAAWLGLDLQPHDLSVTQVCSRSLVVFVATLVIVRLAHKGALERNGQISVIPSP